MPQDTNEKKLPMGSHTVLLDNRGRAVFSGVTEVEEFDDGQISLVTVMGRITLSGEGLHINRLDLESGQLVADGKIDSIEYEDMDDEAPRGIFGRLFR